MHLPHANELSWLCYPRQTGNLAKRSTTADAGATKSTVIVRQSWKSGQGPRDFSCWCFVGDYLYWLMFLESIVGKA